MLGRYATPALIVDFHRQLGLDKPIYSQYLIYLDRIAHGNLGYSYFYGTPVSQLLGDRVGVTLSLAGLAAILSIVVSVPLALLAAMRRESIWDQLVRAVLIAGNSLPGYWIGLLLILLFAVKLGFFPVGGYGVSLGDHLLTLFLPALTASIGIIPTLVRALRASLIEALAADYIAMARAKGLPNRVVILRHAFRNALIPAVTILGLNVGFLVGGLVIIEAVFGVPGLGQLMITAISTRDYPIVQGAVLLFGIIVVLVNLVTDIIIAFLDPRVRASLG